MFVETIAVPRSDWERWEERLRYSTDPPQALIATIVWDSGERQVAGVNVWDTPEAHRRFYMARVSPIVEVEGEPANKPQRPRQTARVLSSSIALRDGEHLTPTSAGLGAGAPRRTPNRTRNGSDVAPSRRTATATVLPGRKFQRDDTRASDTRAT